MSYQQNTRVEHQTPGHLSFSEAGKRIVQKDWGLHAPEGEIKAIALMDSVDKLLAVMCHISRQLDFIVATNAVSSGVAKAKQYREAENNKFESYLETEKVVDELGEKIGVSKQACHYAARIICEHGPNVTAEEAMLTKGVGKKTIDAVMKVIEAYRSHKS